ncbi:trifunctional dihydropteroate synthetase [Elasticomyces elasticus]
MVRVRLIQSTTALTRKVPGIPSRAARRQAARTISPADGAFVTSTSDVLAPALTESIDSPSARSPRHPLASTAESGLFKYKTGIEEFSQPLRRFNGGRYIWKIYTAQPVLHDYRPALVAAIQEDDLPNGPATLLSTLRAAYLSALRAFGAFPSTRDVHLQYLSNYTGRALVIPGLARPVGTEDRVWNMRMMLHKPSTHAALSLPLVIISIPHVAISKYCTILIHTADGRQNTIWALNIRVSGSLKASVFDPQTMNPTTSSSEQAGTKTDPIQSVVNRVLRETGTRVQARIFNSTHDLLSELEQIITQSLRTSGLATVLDLHGILLELVSDRRIRISHNRLLNPDGTPIKPLEFSITPHARSTASNPEPAVTLSAPLRAETTIGSNTTDDQDIRTSVSPNEPGTRAIVSSLKTIKIKPTTLSVAASERLGITTLRAVLAYVDIEDKTEVHARSSYMVPEIERFCESSAESGLPCWLAAVQYLSNRFSNATATTLFSDHITIPSSWSNTMKRSTNVLISIVFPATTSIARSPLRLDFTGFPEMRFKMRNVSSPCVVNVDRLHVEFDLATGEKGAGGPNHSMNQDLRQLAETSHRVIEQLSKAMTFAEEASIPARLSEALLRVLRADTYAGELVRVAVFLRPVTDNVLLPGAEESPQDTQLAVASPPTVAETTSDTPDWWTEHELPISSSVAFTEALESMTPMAPSIRFLQGTASGGVHLISSGSIILFNTATLKSASLKRMTGMQHYGYKVIWSSQRTYDAVEITTSSIENSLEKSFSMNSARGIDCLLIAATHLAEILPGQPRVVLEMRGSLPDQSYGPAYRLSNVLSVNIRVNKEANNGADTRSTTVRIVLPIVRGFACSDGTIENLILIKVQHTLKSRSEQGSAKDIIELANNTIASIIHVVEPLFSTADPDALDDSFARTIAAALQHRRTLCLDANEPDHIDVKVGRGQGNTIIFSGSAQIRSTEGSVEEAAGKSTLLPVLEAADTDEARMDAVFTESPHEEQSSSNVHVEQQKPTKDSGSTPERPCLIKFGAGGRSILETNILSENGLKRTGLARFGMITTWPTLPEHGALSVAGLDFGTILRQELQAAPGHGLQYLCNTAHAVRRALPWQPTTLIRCRPPSGHWAPRMEEHSYQQIFELTAIVKHTSTSQECREQAATVILKLPKLLGMVRSRRYWFRVDITGQYVALATEHTNSELLTEIVPAVRNVLLTALAELGSLDEVAAAPTHIAQSVAMTNSPYPDGFSVRHVGVVVSGDTPSHIKTEYLGRGAWGQADDISTKHGGSFVALGSNVGDRLSMIEKACTAMNEDSDIQVIRTSPLYETEPMYVESQERFLNGVCELHTTLPPAVLLDRLQAIEQRLGRVKLIEKGPRSIDLDILTHRTNRISTERLTIPHALMMEREFVLRPLTRRMPRPLREPIAERAKDFEGKPREMFSHTPLGPGTETIHSTDPRRETRVMAILNVTPDSFSDGGTNEPADLDSLKATIENYIVAGASIIDIGGQSSRPNAPDVTAEEEIARILPAIKVIRSLPSASHIAISIDTYRAAVAKAAIEAGAHIINDISAGTLDPDMLRTVAELGCTYIMMHMRGTPATMQDPDNLSYPKGLIPTVADELRVCLDAAQEAGIRRWRIILDPGIGFAKTQEQNLDILRKLPELAKSRGLADMPWLVGSSRKGFIGKITGVEAANERTWGTAATVTQAVQGGADIVRVHDVAEMAQVVKMADAMYRV